MAKAIPKYAEEDVEREKANIRKNLPDLSKRSPLEVYQIEQCIDDCATWVVITDTLKRDVLDNGVIQNQSKGGKDNRHRVQVERETMALLHKVQPRMYDAFKMLDSLCARGEKDKGGTDDPFIAFAAN